jgi:hypothetical protein
MAAFVALAVQVIPLLIQRDGLTQRIYDSAPKDLIRKAMRRAL